MTATFLFGEDVDGRGELIVRDDRARLRKNLTTFNLVMGDAAEKGADVIAALGEIKSLAEHFKTGDNGLLSRTNTDNFNFVVDLDLATLDTASDDGATARDGHDVFDRHQERLIVGTDRVRDVSIKSVE